MKTVSEIQISVVDTYDKMKQLQPEWNDLLRSSSANTMFLTFEWLLAWTEVFLSKNRKLFILTFSEDEKLVGIAPFYIDSIKFGIFTLKEIRFIGFPEAGSDYLDVIVEKGREQIIAASIFTHLLYESRSKWDVIRIYNIRSNSLFLLYFMNRFEAVGKFYQISMGPYCPQVLLPASESDFYTGLSKGRRKKLKRDIRVIFREDSAVHRFSDGVNTSAYLDEFFDLYDEKTSWNGDRIKLFLENYLNQCVGTVSLQVDLLTVKNQNIAGLLHLRYGKSISLFLMAVDKEHNPKISIGNALVGLCIKNSINEKLRYYDFLKGDEPYKFHWASGGVRCMMFSFWNKRPSAVAINLYQYIKSILKLIIR